MTETVKRGRGRPSKFKPEFIRQAKLLANKAFTDAEVAEFFEVPRQTLYRWLSERPDFRDALKLGKEESDNRVERSLFERAVGYRHPDTHISNYQGVITLTPFEKHYPPDSTACIFWLKNRRPETWRDKPEGTGLDAEDIAKLARAAVGAMTKATLGRNK